MAGLVKPVSKVLFSLLGLLVAPEAILMAALKSPMPLLTPIRAPYRPRVKSTIGPWAALAYFPVAVTMVAGSLWLWVLQSKRVRTSPKNFKPKTFSNSPTRDEMDPIAEFTSSIEVPESSDPSSLLAKAGAARTASDPATKSANNQNLFITTPLIKIYNFRAHQLLSAPCDSHDLRTNQPSENLDFSLDSFTRCESPRGIPHPVLFFRNRVLQRRSGVGRE